MHENKIFLAVSPMLRTRGSNVDSFIFGLLKKEGRFYLLSPSYHPPEHKTHVHL